MMLGSLCMLFLATACQVNKTNNFYYQDESNQFGDRIRAIYRFSGQDTLYGSAFYMPSMPPNEASVFVRCSNTDSLAYQLQNDYETLPCEYILPGKKGNLRMVGADGQTSSTVRPIKAATTNIDMMKTVNGDDSRNFEWQDNQGNRWNALHFGSNFSPKGGSDSYYSMCYVQQVGDQFFFTTEHSSCIFHISSVDVERKVLQLQKISCLQDSLGPTTSIFAVPRTSAKN